MKIQKIKKKQKVLTFKDLKVGDLFRDTSSAVISMKVPPRLLSPQINAYNMERNLHIYRTPDSRVIRIDATLVVKE